MKRILFLLFMPYSLFVAPSTIPAAENQTWKVRPGDNLEIIAATVEIPTDEIKKLNPGIVETHLQIGQKLKLPLRSYPDSRALEEELKKKDARIVTLERRTRDLENKIAVAESRLTWHPVWVWGFWICFGILAFIAAGTYWIFRQTHPRVLEQPRDRSVRDLRESQMRLRSSFPR